MKSKYHFIYYHDEETGQAGQGKFWNITIDDLQFTTVYGKIDTKGVSNTNNFDTQEQCQKESIKIIENKIKKGYKYVDKGENIPEFLSNISFNKEKPLVKNEKPLVKNKKTLKIKSNDCRNNPEKCIAVSKEKGKTIFAGSLIL